MLLRHPQCETSDGQKKKKKFCRSSLFHTRTLESEIILLGNTATESGVNIMQNSILSVITIFYIINIYIIMVSL